MTRIFNPDGSANVERAGIPRGFLGDLYHFLLVASWPLLLGLLVAAYLASNALFALGYLLQPDSLENARPGSFADAFFFSVQTMATIGYGKLVPRTWLANMLVTIESFVGLLGLAMVTGLIFAKFSRPTARVLFSRVAIMGRRDGVPCLLFRMANARGNHIAEAQVHVVLARDEVTGDGERMRRFHDLSLLRAHNAIFALSWTVAHPMVAGSPLFGATEATLRAARAEIVVSLIGFEETFAQTVHARHAYAVDDLLWNARFVDIVSEGPDGRRRVDYARFHEVEADRRG